jgi:sugar/nucleoside kinase (ribokinase family)
VSRLGIIGLTARDRVDDGPATIGGAPFYCLQALSQVDAAARVVTKVAPADETLLEPLDDAIVWRPAARTASYRLTYDAASGRREISVDELGEPWNPAEITAWVLPALTGCEIVHAGALSAADFPPQSLALLSQHHRVSLDGQGLVRPARAGPVALERPDSLELLEHVDVLKLSEREARVLGIEPTALSMSTLGVPEVILTSGEHGALVLSHGALVEVKSEPVAVRDATGAGDGFIACYLHARLGGATGAEAGAFAARAVAAMLRARAGGS